MKYPRIFGHLEETQPAFVPLRRAMLTECRLGRYLASPKLPQARHSVLARVFIRICGLS
jgi:hypothetical protein